MKKDLLKDRKPLHNKKGTTLVELVVVFALILIFVAMTGQVIASAMGVYQKVEGLDYGRQVSDTIINKIEGELSGARVMSAVSHGGSVDPHSLKIYDGGETIEFYNAAGSLVRIYSGTPQKYTYDGTTESASAYDADNPANWGKQLIIHYAAVKTEDGSSIAYQPVDWTFDKNMYQGYEIESLVFSRPDYDAYPLNIIKIDLKLKSAKYGSFEVTQYIDVYNFKGNEDKIFESGHPAPTPTSSPAPIPLTTPTPSPAPSDTPMPSETPTPTPSPTLTPEPTPTPTASPSAAPVSGNGKILVKGDNIAGCNVSGTNLIERLEEIAALDGAYGDIPAGVYLVNGKYYVIPNDIHTYINDGWFINGSVDFDAFIKIVSPMGCIELDPRLLYTDEDLTNISGVYNNYWWAQPGAVYRYGDDYYVALYENSYIEIYDSTRFGEPSTGDNANWVKITDLVDIRDSQITDTDINKQQDGSITINLDTKAFTFTNTISADYDERLSALKDALELLESPVGSTIRIDDWKAFVEFPKGIYTIDGMHYLVPEDMMLNRYKLLESPESYPKWGWIYKINTSTLLTDANMSYWSGTSGGFTWSNTSEPSVGTILYCKGKFYYCLNTTGCNGSDPAKNTSCWMDITDWVVKEGKVVSDATPISDEWRKFFEETDWKTGWQTVGDRESPYVYTTITFTYNDESTGWQNVTETYIMIFGDGTDAKVKEIVKGLVAEQYPDLTVTGIFYKDTEVTGEPEEWGNQTDIKSFEKYLWKLTHWETTPEDPYPENGMTFMFDEDGNMHVIAYKKKSS